MPEAFKWDADESALLEDRIGKRMTGEVPRLRSPYSQVPQIKLTRLERKAMEALWACGKASIREILEAFPEPRPAYTTIQTIVYRLEGKNAVHRVRKVSNAHIFEPLVFPAAAPSAPNGTPSNGSPSNGTRHRLLDEVLSFFGGRQPMMEQMIESGKLTLEDVRELEKTLEERAS
ncbi:MAG TPA: BlaI/MecI/CopY family transcriptional regulator [Bryobacteraceae bacterium]|jgi:predicted transcriptional regulator